LTGDAVRILLYGIARQRLHYEGRAINLAADGEWRRLVRSLKAHIPLTRPPLRRDHDPATSGALGYVSEVVGPVSRAQLIRAGVPEKQLPHREYVMFRAELTARGAREYRGGDIARTSIGLSFDMVDDQGRKWPYFLEELSVVDRPHVRTQPTAQELSGVTMRAGARASIYLSGAAIQRSSMTDEQRKRLADGIAALVADILTGPEDTADEVAAETAEDVIDTLAADEEEVDAMANDDEEKRELKARVAELEAKHRVAELSAKLDKSGIVLSADERKDLLRVGVNDAKAFDLAIRLAAKGNTVRLAASGGAPEEEVDPQTAVNRKALRLVEAMAAKGGAA
jgi:hypothetical protein